MMETGRPLVAALAIAAAAMTTPALAQGTSTADALRIVQTDACRGKTSGALGNSLKLPDDAACLVLAQDEYVRFPDPEGKAAYPTVDGAAMKADIDRIVAFSRKSRDDGNQYWGRIPGTPYDRMTRDWVEAQFRQIGLTSVRQQEVALDTVWYPTSWTASYSVGGKATKLATVFPINDTPGTSAQGVDADLVWVGLGTAADFRGRDVKGKAVMIYSVPTPGGRDHTAEWNGAMQRASDAGAAVVFVVMGFPGSSQTNPEGADRLTSPTVTVSTVEADAIRDQLERGAAVSMHLTLNIEHRKGGTSGNVWGVLPGTTDEQILVMAHTDCFFDGALDNASGMAAMLAIARHYASLPQASRRRTLVFLTTPDHHHGAAGIKWIRDHYDFGKVALIVNSEHPSQTLVYWFQKGLMTSSAVSARRWYAGGSPALQAIVKDKLRQSGVATYRMPEFRPGGELQHIYKLAPSFEIIDHVIYHSTLDTSALVPDTGLEEAARGYLRIIDAANGLTFAQLRSN